MRNLRPLPFNDDLSQVLFEVVDPEKVTVCEKIQAEDWNAKGNKNEHIHHLVILALDAVQMVELVLDTDDPRKWDED